MYLVDTFPNLGEVAFVGDIICVPAAQAPLIIRAICYRCAPYVGLWVLLFWWSDSCGLSHSHGWPWVWLIVKPCFLWRLPATGWWKRVTSQLAEVSQHMPGLVLAHSWTESWSRRSWGWSRLKQTLWSVRMEPREFWGFWLPIGG